MFKFLQIGDFVAHATKMDQFYVSVDIMGHMGVLQVAMVIR